jgi:hypothetical protein
MSDIQLLFAVLVALYLWECACWLRRGSVAFTTWLGRRWQLLHPGALVGNQRGGFILAVPLPPLGTLLTASQFPLSLSPDGVLAFVSTNVNPGPRGTQSAKFMRWDEIQDVHARGKKVFINGDPFISLFSAALARQTAVELESLRKLKLPQREAALANSLRLALDIKTAERRWNKARPLTQPVRWLANFLFFFLFAYIPFVIWRVGLSSSWLPLLIGLFALTIATAFFFRRAHCRLFPKAEDERFTHTLTIALAPTSATRAHDALLRPLLETFHPLVTAKLFLANKDFEDFARRVFRDLKHPALPLCPCEVAAAQAAELYHRNALRTAIEKFLKQAGLDVGALLGAPEPLDESCRAYCPRCETQFTNPDGKCNDCGGLALIEFPERTAIATA